MSGKNIDVMKKVIEAKKEKSVQQGLSLRPHSKSGVAEKASIRRKRR